MSVWTILCIVIDSREVDYAAQVVLELFMHVLILPTATTLWDCGNIAITKTIRATPSFYLLNKLGQPGGLFTTCLIICVLIFLAPSALTW